MKELIKKLIIWALGYKPYAATEWKVYVEGDNKIETLTTEEHGFPPRIVRRPVVTPKEYREGDMPELAEIETLAPLSYDFDSKIVIYRKIGVKK
jgi:hypothetical protein